MSRFNWSKPHYGVHHLLGVPDTHQVAVTEFGSRVDAFVLHISGRTPFTPIHEETFGNVADAKKWCEKKARAL